VRAKESMEHRLQELEAIAATSQSISSTTELSDLYKILHEHIRKTIGEVGFLVALFDKETNSIQIPYMFERGNNEITSLEPFPLGEGLTSILIRTRQPLMLIEDTEKRAIALGARIVGQPAKSWLGAPLVTGGEPTGAIIIQDTENERAFDESDLRFITTLASQVAGAIHNTRLLQETKFRAIQLQTAAEIARDISGSLELGDLLYKAVNLIRDHLNYYHAAVFLVDHNNEYATIREATGEAGAQMKRAGHKLAVGSKSIVGFVTSSGEPLVVNDTTRDATYYANPLLPDTRAELAIPLRVGTRIIGALDVQSTTAYSFTDETINVLRILADQLAIAVVNSELFAETQEHLAQHRLLHHVTTAAAGTTLDEALSSAVQGLQVTLGGDRVSILLANREKRGLEVKSAVGYGDDVSHIKVGFGKGITGWVAEHKLTQRIDDVTKDPRYIRVGSDVVSELAIPLVYRNELLGVLNVESDQPAAYNENDEEMLGTLGGSLAAIIANARLLEQIRRQIDRERLLYEVTSKIRRFTDTESIMETTVSELSKALGAQHAQIKINPPGSGSVSRPDNPQEAGDR
jgi:GAF domain-containing protein